MARRKKSRTPRRRFTGINVTDAALGYAGVAIWSDALLGVDPIQFFTDKTGGGSTFKITGRELLDGLMGGTSGVYAGHVESGRLDAQNALAVIRHNATQNAGGAIFKSIGLGIAGNVGKKVTRKPRAFLNKQLRNFGMGDFIRF
tara:strand:+ start:309 stop:740 length:432 start_codon:yes stop_codon:yes gene_type:complete